MVETKNKVLVVIPARGGSKGLPRKNIKLLLGQPLIAYTIKHALNSRLVGRTIVSTEDLKIKKIALKHGAEVIDRPKKLATDKATTWSVLYHVLKKLEPTYKPDVVVLLQVTSPIRKPDLIDRCVKKFLETRVDSLVTGHMFKELPYGQKPRRRQEIKGTFINDGSVYVIKPEIILKGETIGETYGFIFTSREENVDIDTEFDFWLAEKVLQERWNASL